MSESFLIKLQPATLLKRDSNTVASCECYEIFKNNFEEHLQTVAFEVFKNNSGQELHSGQRFTL